MERLQAKIIGLLAKQRLQPGELAGKLGISRQLLHKHLRILVAAKRIQKHGTGPHVTYSAATKDTFHSRVQRDFAFCRDSLLPQYIDEHADFLRQYVRRLHVKKANDKADFGFLLESAAVYSSNIEGNTLDLNAFLNSRMSPKKHRPKEAQEIEDLLSAYSYARQQSLGEQHLLQAHKTLSRGFVARSRQGVYRREPVGVFSQQGLVYMAVEPHFVAQEMHALLEIISQLPCTPQDPAQCFFWAAWLHLMIALIHPFSDGNGRTARLCEKWFLSVTLGAQNFALESEKHYWKNRSAYYAALKLGVNYWETDMSKALPFFVLLPRSLNAEKSHRNS